MANVYTHAGKAITARRLIGATPAQTEPKFVGWGTGAGTALVTDTTLSTEAAEARVTATASTVTTAQTNDTYQTVATIVSASAQTITNAGVLDAATVGNLFQKSDHAGVGVAIGDGIQYTFKTQFT